MTKWSSSSTWLTSISRPCPKTLNRLRQDSRQDPLSGSDCPGSFLVSIGYSISMRRQSSTSTPYWRASTSLNELPFRLV
ncbi:MAG: hypothetical protein Q9164_007616, partial [Protoblastenia rupestris]